MRRAFRIFPLYYLFLIIYFYVVPIITNTQQIPFSKHFYFWIYLQNFAFTFNWPIDGPNHYWSLAVEEHFYLFWPIIVFYLKIKDIIKVIFVLIIVALFTRFLLLKFGYGVFYFTFSRMDELVIGA